MAISQISKYTDPDGSVYTCEPKAAIKLFTPYDTLYVKDFQTLTTVIEKSNVASQYNAGEKQTKKMLQTFDVGGKEVIFDVAYDIFSHVNSLQQRIEMPYIKVNSAKYGAAQPEKTDTRAEKPRVSVTGMRIVPHAPQMRGTIVDSTIISAPSSTKNKEKKRDPAAHSVKKGTAWHFGYKAHIGVDKDSGLVHHVEVTSDNVHDVEMTPKLMTGDESELYGDSGYIGAEKRQDAIVRNNQGKKIRYKQNRKPTQIKKLSASGQWRAKQAEHQKSSVRAKAEHVFAVIKGQFRYRKMRYRGLSKQTAKLNMLFALANLVMADRRCPVV